MLPAVYSGSIPLTVAAWDAPGEPVSFDEAMGGDYRPFAIGDHWSRPWGTTWFRFSVDVPAAMAGPQLEAVIDLGFHPDSAGFQSEGLVWIDGQPVQGIHPRRTGLPLPQIPPGPFTFFVEAASNPAFPGYRPSPLGSLATAGDKPLYRLRQASLGRRDDAVFHLLLDVDVLFGLARSLPTGDGRRIRVLRQLEAAFNVLDLDDVGATADAARRVLQPALGLTARAGAHRVVAVGHAHIDSAWLWPIRETQRKCARTFASAIRLMDDYPDYHFTCSQAAQYDWIERSHPTLFQRIRDKVAAGPVASGRRHVGRARHEPSKWREHRAPVGVRAALLRVAVRDAQFGDLDPGCVRLPGDAAADLPTGRLLAVRHPEVELEQAERLPAFDVLVGGPRRLAGAHPLPAGRHLQRRDHRQPRCATPKATSRSTAGATGR